MGPERVVLERALIIDYLGIFALLIIKFHFKEYISDELKVPPFIHLLECVELNQILPLLLSSALFFSEKEGQRQRERANLKQAPGPV